MITDRHSQRAQSAVTGALAPTLFLALSATGAAQQTWDYPQPANAPTARAAHGMAYHAGSQRTVLFGGCDASKCNAETWLWNGTDWTQAAPATSPAKRHGMAMAYDEGRDVVVLFGGGNLNNRLYRDTWEWNGTTWTQVATTGPSPRWNAGMAYDPVRQRMVMFGGSNLTTPFRETWEWDGVSWSLRSTQGPSARINPGFAWDGVNGEILMVGGLDITGIPPLTQDTWLWNGFRWKIVALNGPFWSAGPSGGLYAGTAAWHEQVQRVVFHSGTVAILGSTTGVSNEETWEWDGSSWDQKVFASFGSGVAWAGSAYDRDRGAFVVFGGNSYTAPSFNEVRSVYTAGTSEYVVDAPASWSTIGTGCNGSAGPLTVTGDDLSPPWIGEAASFVVSNIFPGSPYLLGYGSSATTFGGQSLPVSLDPFGATGCTLWASAEIASGLAITGVGTVRIGLSIPFDLSILGQQVYVQAFMLDTVNPRGLVVSNAECGTAGWRF